MFDRTRAAIKLILYFSKCVGIMPFTIHWDDNILQFKLTKLSITISLFMSVFIVIPNCYSLYQLYVILIDIYQDAPVNVIVRCLINILNSVCHICTPVVLLKNRLNLNFVLNKLIQNFTCESKTNHLFYVILQIIIGFSQIILSSIIFILSYPEEEGIFNFFTYTSNLFAVYLMLLQFVNCLLLMKENLKLINSKILILATQNIQVKHQHLKKLLLQVGSLQRTICNSSDIISLIYSLPLLILVLQLFFWNLHMFYFCILKVIGYKIEGSIVFLLYALSYGSSELFLLTCTCQQVKQE
ncbi:hypothetical protein L9F63_010395, partial [Diploptera punctata]